MRNIVEFNTPVLRPLPTELTVARLAEQTMPAKIEAARRAVALCTDLSELLTWKDKMSAIAAAAKIAKMPDIAKDANRICKEALLRLGELLLAYSPDRPRAGIARSAKKEASPRYAAARSAGVTDAITSVSTRFAAAPKEIIKSVLADTKIGSAEKSMRTVLPRLMALKGAPKSGDAIKIILRGNHSNTGLTTALTYVQSVPLELIDQVTDTHEIKKIRNVVTQMMEALDEIDRRLK